MENIDIRYCFTLPDESEHVFDLQLRRENLELVGNVPQILPSWTSLGYHQCPNCPLTVDTHPNCPLAVNLVNVVRPFTGILSHNEIHVEVKTEERTVSKATTAEEGIGSLLGLVMATSGCPHLAFFKPMARFHLPLASEEETIYRATSMYLLAQYFLKKREQNADLELEGLTKIYNNIQAVNIAIATRLRSATDQDSTINAVVILDVYAKTLEYAIEESLEEIVYLFTPFFEKILDS